jgi:hypothetical protein
MSLMVWERKWGEKLTEGDRAGKKAVRGALGDGKGNG